MLNLIVLIICACGFYTGAILGLLIAMKFEAIKVVVLMAFNLLLTAAWNRLPCILRYVLLRILWHLHIFKQFRPEKRHRL